MLEQYGLGILAAILSGALHAFGAILQKSAVNRIPVAQRDDRFMSRLLRSPAWLAGLAMSFGVGTIFNLLAQKMIGPALVPGLTASGMIVLAVAAGRLIGEQLRPLETLGILLLVAGTGLLGWSRLAIPSDQVNLLDPGLLLRILCFTAGLGACWFVSFWLARQAASHSRGLLMAVSGGFPFCLSNLWILPMLLTIGRVFGGMAVTLEVLLFVVACGMLVGTNAAGIRQTQEAYKFAPASKVQPIQQIPTQIVPILLYFVVFRRSASGLALVLIPVAVLLIIAAGFLLGERKAEL
jgi:drug/metabolite transporter (DMT)-like permease